MSRREALSGETMIVFSGMGGVALGDSRDAFLRVGNLCNPCPAAKAAQRRRRASPRGQMLDGSQQLGIFLTHDLVKLRRLHSRLQELLEGLSGIDALVLAGVANEAALGRRASLRGSRASAWCCARDWIHRPYRGGARGRRLWPARARKPCNVSAEMPASRSCCAAREVGAKPSTT